MADAAARTPEVLVAANPGFPVAEDAIRDTLATRARYRLASIDFQGSRERAEEELLSALGDAEALFMRAGRIGRRAIEGASRLRIITIHGAGVDNVDVEAATEHGVYVATVPGANANAVAELVFGLAISLLRRIPTAAWAVQRAGGWDEGRHLGGELRGRTLAVVGLGRVGRRVAALGRAFGMHVIAHDPAISEDTARSLDAEPASLDGLFREGDVVTLHVPLTGSTHHLVGAERLATMKPDAILINASRGEVVDGQALYEALAERRLAGAALDVMEREPPAPDDPLRSLENVVITPHIGGSTYECLASIARTACEDILRVFEGEQPRFLANPAVIDVASQKFRRG